MIRNLIKKLGLLMMNSNFFGQADENKFSTLLSKLEQEEKELEESLDKWESLINRNTLVREKLDQSRLSIYIVEAKKIHKTLIQASSLN